MSELRFTVPGPPQPKQRARKGKHGVFYTPDQTRLYESAIGARCSIEVAATKDWRAIGRYAVHVTTYFGDDRRRDVDNVLKSVLDGCNGIAWDDDSQVDEIHCMRRKDQKNPRTEVTIVLLGRKESAA